MTFFSPAADANGEVHDGAVMPETAAVAGMSPDTRNTLRQKLKLEALLLSAPCSQAPRSAA